MFYHCVGSLACKDQGTDGEPGTQCSSPMTWLAQRPLEAAHAGS